MQLGNQEEWVLTGVQDAEGCLDGIGSLSNIQDQSSLHPCDDSLFLPRLTTPIENNTFVENRKIVVNCVKISMGAVGQRVGWGLPENKPAWWPPHVPWTKRGVQQGVTNEDLKDVITACYQHHDQPMCYVSITLDKIYPVKMMLLVLCCV